MNEIRPSQANIGLAPKARFASAGKENFIHFRETDNQLFTPKTIEKIISGRATPEELFVLKLYLKVHTGKPIDFEKGLEQESVKRAIQELDPSATDLNSKLLEAMKGEIIVTNSHEVLKDGGFLGSLNTGDRRLYKKSSILSIKSSDPSTWKVTTFNANFLDGTDKPKIVRREEDTFDSDNGVLPANFSGLAKALPDNVTQRDRLANKSLSITDYPILEDREVNTRYQAGLLKYLQNSASSPNKAISEKILQEALLTKSSNDRGSLLSSELETWSSNLKEVLNKKINEYALLNQSEATNTPTQQLVKAKEKEILALLKIYSTLDSSDARRVFFSREKDLIPLTNKYDLNNVLEIKFDDAVSITKKIGDDFVWGRKDIDPSNLKLLRERLSELSEHRDTLLEKKYPEIFINSPSNEHLSLNNINISLGVKTTENDTNNRIEPESLYPPSLKAKVDKIMNNNQLALSLNEPLKKQLRNKVEAFVKSNQFPTDINAQNKLIETQVKSLLENQIISLGPESEELNKLKQEIKYSIKTKIQAYSESKDIRFERDEKQEKGIAEEIKLFYLLANHSEREAFLEETRAETYPQLKNIKVSDLIDSFSKQGEQDTSIKKQDNLTTRLWFADTGRDDPRNEDFKNSVPNFKKQISMVNAFLDSSSELDPASKQKTKNLLSEFTGLQDISHYDSLAGYNATELKTQYPYLNPRQGKWIESNLSTERFGPFGLISSLARFAADTLIGR